MATTFDTPRARRPYAEQVLEASTRAINATAELYTEVLSNTQAEATRALLEAYSGLGAQAVQIGSERAAETTERAAETTERATETAARTTRRPPARTARATSARPAAPASDDPPGREARAARRPRRAAGGPHRAISGYDDLTAEEIVAKLPEQPQTTLVEIATYEQAKRSARPCCSASPRSAAPSRRPGYDELNADEAQKLITSGSPTLAAAVRDYERRHKDRASVIEAAVRHADAVLRARCPLERAGGASARRAPRPLSRRRPASSSRCSAAPDRSCLATNPHAPIRTRGRGTAGRRSSTSTITAGPPLSAVSRSATAKPSMSGRRTSSSTTSGRRARAASIPDVPSVRLADDLPAVAFEQRARSGPEGGVIVDDEERRGHAVVRGAGVAGSAGNV